MRMNWAVGALPGKCSQGDRPPEKRKVDSSILSLTTTPELAALALLPAETQEERVFRQCVRQIPGTAPPCLKAANRAALRAWRRGDERETTAVPTRRRRRPKQLDAGPFAADVASFGLHLAAENKAAGTKQGQGWRSKAARPSGRFTLDRLSYGPPRTANPHTKLLPRRAPPSGSRPGVLCVCDGRRYGQNER